MRRCSLSRSSPTSVRYSGRSSRRTGKPRPRRSSPRRWTETRPLLKSVEIGGVSPVSDAREWLRGANAVAVLTGAGISAESGVPTFRGAAGLWREYRPEELATPEAFARDPKLVWEWYSWRRGLIADTKPNSGHEALVEIERRIERFALVTQNVDGLHDKAGSRNI
ncbi:MAG: hypothetical protein GY953_58535, partial [bacterium]|nr:hypothetical protein [bacterium]